MFLATRAYSHHLNSLPSFDILITDILHIKERRLLFQHYQLFKPRLSRPSVPETKVKMPTGKPVPNMMDNEVVALFYTCLKNYEGAIDFKAVATALGMKDAAFA